MTQIPVNAYMPKGKFVAPFPQEMIRRMSISDLIPVMLSKHRLVHRRNNCLKWDRLNGINVFGKLSITFIFKR